MSDRSGERPIVVRLLGERPFGGHSERVALWGVQGGIGLMTAPVCLLFFVYNDRFGDPPAESFGAVRWVG